MTKTDPTKPHKITYADAGPGTVCTKGGGLYGPCGRRARWDISWKHMHRGMIKTAKRKRCSKHGRKFFSKHGVKVSSKYEVVT